MQIQPRQCVLDLLQLCANLASINLKSSEICLDENLQVSPTCTNRATFEQISSRIEKKAMKIMRKTIDNFEVGNSLLQLLAENFH